MVTEELFFEHLLRVHSQNEGLFPVFIVVERWIGLNWAPMLALGTFELVCKVDCLFVWVVFILYIARQTSATDIASLGTVSKIAFYARYLKQERLQLDEYRLNSVSRGPAIVPSRLIFLRLKQVEAKSATKNVWVWEITTNIEEGD